MKHLCNILFALAIIARPALGQEGGGIDLQAFKPAMDSRGFITLNSSRTLGHNELSFGLVTSWGKGVLRLQEGVNSYAVEHVFSPALVGAYGLRLGGLSMEVGASMPFVVVAGDRSPDSDAGTPAQPNDDQNYRFSGQGIGNVGFHLKTRILREDRLGIGVAAIASVFLPTSDGASWLGDDALGGQSIVAVDKQIGSLRLGINGGVRFRSGNILEFTDNIPLSSSGIALPMTGKSVSVGTTLPFGVAASYAVTADTFDVIGEVFGAAPLSGENYYPLEALAGAKLYLGKSSFLTFGAGAGLRPKEGANPELRAFMGIVFEPFSGDRDGDGMDDSDDECPDVPEDRDGFQDLDGCPDRDNDGDEILDVEDACPDRAEDRDGFADEDGCPEDQTMDRDKDKISDDLDECPDEAEDFDKFEDSNGCPDDDNDSDRILDMDDLCPNLAEDYNGRDDGDGCPDQDRDVVIDPSGSIVVLKEIKFEFNSAKIKPESYPILDSVAETLELNSDLLLVEVQGHTDERGSEAYNEKLSAARAHAVMTYLVDKGIEAHRLEAAGYGETQPKKPGHTEAAWRMNRRVEFIILRKE